MAYPSLRFLRNLLGMFGVVGLIPKLMTAGKYPSIRLLRGILGKLENHQVPVSATWYNRLTEVRVPEWPPKVAH
jgi:hypothetical protein